MKSKVLLLVSSIILSTTAFAQKEELKTLKKIYAREKTSDSDMAEFKATLTKVESLVANSTEDDKVYFAFYKAMSPVLEMNLVMSKPENLNNPALILKYLTVDNVSQLVTNLNATLDYEKKSGKQVYTKDIEETITSFKPMIVNFAIALANNSNYKDAAVVLHAIYELDKKDVEKLYYSANYAVNSKDYDLSLKYYQELKALNYTGADMAYYAINKETKKEDSFNTKAERDIYLKGNSHEKPRDEKLPSKRPEIFKNIALIYVELGKSAEAKAAIKEARIENPEDVALILTEADLFLKEKDMVSYKKLIVEALEKNPNDAILVFNLGVVSYNNKELVDA